MKGLSFIILAAVAGAFLSATAFAAGPLTLELEITNSGKSANDVIGKFTFPACATLINLPGDFSWEPALHTLLVPIGDFAAGEKKTISVQASPDSQSCLEKNQISGDWYSDTAAPAGNSPISFPKLSDINFDLVRRALFGVGGVVGLILLVYGVLLYRRVTSLYGLIIDTGSKNQLPGTKVTVYQAGNDKESGSVTADKEGRVMFRLMPGRYYIVCAQSGYQELRTGAIEIEKGTEVSQVFELKRLG